MVQLVQGGLRSPDVQCEAHFDDGDDDNYGDGNIDGDGVGQGETNCW